MLLTYTIPDTQHEMLFFGLPDNAKHVDITGLAPNNLSLTWFSDAKGSHFPLPFGNWQLLGTLDQIKEEDLKCYTVNPLENSKGDDIIAYANYRKAQSRTFSNWAILVRTLNK